MLSRIASKSVVEMVLEQVRSLILDGEVAPNSCLPPETTIARQLGVSRQSVREALRILLGEGLLHVRQGEGIYVRQPSTSDVIQGGVLQLLLISEELWEIQELRRTLEPAIAERAAERATDEDFNRLEEVLHKMERKAARGERSFELAWEFHRVLAEAAGNKSMTKIIEVISEMIRRAEGPLYHSYFDPWQEIKDHRSLLMAIRTRDLTVAREAMKAHLESVDNRLSEALRARTRSESQNGSVGTGECDTQ